MLNTKTTDYLLDEMINAESLFTPAGVKRILKEMNEIEQYELNKTQISRNIPKSYCGSIKINLCCHPGCNNIVYGHSRVCECHKHIYEDMSNKNLKRMFPVQRSIPMIGIYGAFWVWICEYMNKRNRRTGYSAARQEHRLRRIIQYIAASTILTVKNIETYLMTRPRLERAFGSRTFNGKDESVNPTKFVDRLLTNEASLTNILIN